MGYKLGTKLSPDDYITANGDDGMWTQEIDFDEPEWSEIYGKLDCHVGCIEVHAGSEELLNDRVNAIMFGLGLLQPRVK